MVDDGSICGAGFLIFSRGCEAPLSLFPLLKLSNPVSPSKPVSPVRCPLLRAYGGAKRSSVGMPATAGVWRSEAEQCRKSRPILWSAWDGNEMDVSYPNRPKAEKFFCFFQRSKKSPADIAVNRARVAAEPGLDSC